MRNSNEIIGTSQELATLVANNVSGRLFVGNNCEVIEFSWAFE